jgi:hypothetical protein
MKAWLANVAVMATVSMIDNAMRKNPVLIWQPGRKRCPVIDPRRLELLRKALTAKYGLRGMVLLVLAGDQDLAETFVCGTNPAAVFVEYKRYMREILADSPLTSQTEIELTAGKLSMLYGVCLDVN